MNFHTVTERIQFTWSDVYNRFLSALPDVVIALSVLLIGYLIAVFIRKLSVNLLKKLKFDCAAERIHLDKKLLSIGIKHTPSTLLAGLLFWLIMLFALITAAEYAGLKGFVDTLSAFAMYIPKVIAALVILVVGLFLAHFIRNSLQSILKAFIPAAAKLIASFVYTLILIAFTSFALAIAIAMGVGSAPQLKKILSGYYLKEHIQVHDIITVDGQTGTVLKINHSGTELKTDQGTVFIPNDQLLDKVVNKHPTPEK